MADKDRYRFFRIEARELVALLGAGLLDLERRRDPETVRALLRHAHTLKGAARVVQLVEVADEAHAIEELLEPYREAGDSIAPPDIDAALRHVDAVQEMLARLSPADDGAKGTIPGGSSEAAYDAVQVPIEQMDASMHGVLCARIEAHAIAAEHEAIERLGATAGRLLDEVARAAQASPDARPSLKRVEAAAIELRETAEALELSHRQRVDGLMRELEDLHERTSEMRLVPLSTLKNDLERAVRDTAAAGGSSAELLWTGDVRIDAHVLRVIRGALMHAVRNAVAHGIEGAAARTAAGKPPEGRVSIDVRRTGYRVWIRCADDGRGIDAERVREVAVSRGLLSSDEARELDQAGLAQILLGGGVSTARRTTHQAGRGVGLDVVRTSVASMNGVVSLDSEPGRGTVLEIGVPVSLAQLPVLEVRSGPAHALIPLDTVLRTVRFGKGDAPEPDEQGMVLLDDAPVRALNLFQVLRVPEGRAQRKSSVAGVLVATSDGPALLLVDGIGRIEGAIVRPVPPLGAAAPWIGGAVLGADGVPRIVLATNALGRAPHAVLSARVVPQPPPILIVDDSLTTRMLEQSILESAGYEVDLAASAEEALEKLRRNRYSLMLVDVEMPGMDGFTLLERVRDDASLRGLPAILVTSRDSPADRARGQEVGARDYVVKGEFDQEALTRRIRELTS